jgi:hypothetical protein
VYYAKINEVKYSVVTNRGVPLFHLLRKLLPGIPVKISHSKMYGDNITWDEFHEYRQRISRGNK